MTPLPALRRYVDRVRVARTVAGLLVTLLVVVIAVAAVAPERIARSVAGADRGIVLAVAGLLLFAIVLRGLVLWITLRAVGAPVGVGRGVVTYLAVAFVNTVVPGGGAGGAPLAGLVISRSARTDYEAGITATLTVSTLTNLTVGAFGVLGLLVLLLTGAPDDLLVLGWLGVALFVLGVVAAAGLWRVRGRAGTAIVAAVVAVLGALDRRLPWSMPDAVTVERHAGAFAGAVDRIVGGPPAQTASLLALSAAAHLASILALLLAFASLDMGVPVGVLLVVVPTAVLAGLTPAPGAAGGVEVALGALLAVATGQPAAAVGAAVLIYRGSGYAFRIVLGGLAVAALSLLR